MIEQADVLESRFDTTSVTGDRKFDASNIVFDSYTETETRRKSEIPTQELGDLRGNVFSSDHLIALHAVLLQTPLHGVVPESYIPKDGDVEFEDLATPFCQPILPTIRKKYNEFVDILQRLRELPLRRRGLFHSVDDGNFAGELSGHCYFDDPDPEDDEPRDQPILFRAIFSTFIRHLDLGSRWKFDRNIKSVKTVWVVNGRTKPKQWSARSCGSITLRGSQNVPIISFNALKRKPRSMQEHLAQEVGVLIAQAVRNADYLRRACPTQSTTHRDQECFVVTLHGQYLHISTALFPAQLMDSAWKTGRLPSDRYLHVRISPEYNLMVQEDRREITRALVSLLRYVSSGYAKIGILQAKSLHINRAPKE